MSAHRARALAVCRDCHKEGYVFGEVGGGSPYADPPQDAEFYPDIEGSVFERCQMCRWPDLDIDDVLPTGEREKR